MLSQVRGDQLQRQAEAPLRVKDVTWLCQCQMPKRGCGTCSHTLPEECLLSLVKKVQVPAQAQQESLPCLHYPSLSSQQYLPHFGKLGNGTELPVLTWVWLLPRHSTPSPLAVASLAAHFAPAAPAWKGCTQPIFLVK